MNHFTILIIKFIACIISFAIALDLFFDATFVDILAFSLLITIISYAIGDRLILPRVGNLRAVAVDFFMTYTLIWIFGSIVLHNYLQIAWGSIIAATLIAGSEVFVHMFIPTKVSHVERNETSRRIFNPKLAYGTEFAEEEDPRKK